MKDKPEVGALVRMSQKFFERSFDGESQRHIAFVNLEKVR